MDLDLPVACARDTQQELREELRTAALSATPDVDRAQEFLDAQIVQAQGRSFPIEMHYSKRTLPPPWSERGWEGAWAQWVLDALDQGEGDALVFLLVVG